MPGFILRTGKGQNLKLQDISIKKTVHRYFHQQEEYQCEQLRDFVAHLDLPVALPKQKGVTFIYVTGGKADVVAGYDKLELEKGSLLIIQPQKPFFIERSSTDIEGYVLILKGGGVLGSMGNHSLIFNLEFLETWGDSLYNMSHLPIAFIENIFKRIEWEKEHDSSKLTVINAYVITLLLELNHIYNEAIYANKSAINITRRFKNEVYQSLHTSLSLAEYADRLAVSPNHLNKAVKSVTGSSATNLIVRIKVIEAKYLLMMADTNIAEIANRLGFSDTSYFSRYFKKHTSQTPKEFQNTIDLSW